MVFQLQKEHRETKPKQFQQMELNKEEAQSSNVMEIPLKFWNERSFPRVLYSTGVFFLPLGFLCN